MNYSKVFPIYFLERSSNLILCQNAPAAVGKATRRTHCARVVDVTSSKKSRFKTTSKFGVSVSSRSGRTSRMRFSTSPPTEFVDMAIDRLLARSVRHAIFC